ncbi:TRAP transporter large permease [Thioclava sp. BHET1]|nr:TRAP transporter large permease [Thioclava sp. BHET1]
MTIFIGIGSVLMILLLVYSGMQVAIALGLVSGVALWIYSGSADLPVHLAAAAASDSIASYSFGVVPLFILMGAFVGEADLGRDAFRVANSMIGRFRGGLGVATVIANAIFAAITGISIASAAIFSRVAVPEMRRFGYNKRFASGVVAGSSILGMLMPPSVLLIVYAIVAQQSVAAMFRAAVVPALILTAFYMVGIVAMAWLRPEWVQPKPRAQAIERLSPVQFLGAAGPLVILVLLVLGGIYVGIFTPTEAGAAGAAIALVILTLKGRFKLKKFWVLLLDSARLTASILFLIVCATMYSRLLGVTGMPFDLANWMSQTHVEFGTLMLLYCVLMIGLGMILDSTSTMLILIPIFLPAVTATGADPVWFGVVTVLGAEIGLLTPPLGISVFVVRDALADGDTTLGDIFIGAAPFATMMTGLLALLVFFPALTQW